MFILKLLFGFEIEQYVCVLGNDQACGMISICTDVFKSQFLIIGYFYLLSLYTCFLD